MSGSSSGAVSRLDRLGVHLSLACAIQCMTVPVLLSVLPFSGLGPLVADAVETAFLIVSAYYSSPQATS